MGQLLSCGWHCGSLLADALRQAGGGNRYRARICRDRLLALDVGHFQTWLVDINGATPEKYILGAIAIVVMMEALRKASGLPITTLVWLLIIYGFFGYLLPQPLQANYLAPESFILYLYADTNAIPGFVLNIIAGMVLAFIVFGKLMEVSGATQFFNDLAMALMGHRRGGPAKVAVVASGMFGSISSSPVSNIMSTGVVTIPLMKSVGFKPHYAAAIEAVASTGGQIAPPVMGATAFLIAEFLRISYFDVVLAAILPALFYYVCLFMQVDAVAQREGLMRHSTFAIAKARNGAARRLGFCHSPGFACLSSVLAGDRPRPIRRSRRRSCCWSSP